MDLNQGRSSRIDGLEMLRKIESLLSRFEVARVSHSYRQTNRCTDALVKAEYRLNSYMLNLSSTPRFIEELLVKDKLGDFTSRKVFL
ncbi:unnamed protein product [Lathyrus sativus]|nr:unnamed protein product [Lathyrus sativus]